MVTICMDIRSPATYGMAPLILRDRADFQSPLWLGILWILTVSHLFSAWIRKTRSLGYLGSTCFDLIPRNFSSPGAGQLLCAASKCGTTIRGSEPCRRRRG